MPFYACFMLPPSPTFASSNHARAAKIIAEFSVLASWLNVGAVTAVRAMTRSLKELVNFLLDEISLRGDQGM